MTDSMDSKPRDIDFLVITIKDVEAEALNRYGFDPCTDRNGRGFWRKTIANKTMDRNIEIVHYMVGEQGNVRAGVLVPELLTLWKPQCVCVLGIAGGIRRNGVQIGDILIGNQIFYYSLTKEIPKESEIRLDSVKPDSLILSQIQLFKDSVVGLVTKGLATLSKSIRRSPGVHVGPIFCGESVFASAEKTEALLDIHPKGIGVEMESYGVYVACMNSPSRPRAFTIRAVSDCADEEKDESDQPLAAFLAALFFIGFVQVCDLSFTSYDLPNLSLNQTRTIIDYHHNSPDVYEVEKDESIRSFKVNGSTIPLDFLVSNRLLLYVAEEVELQQNTAIQVGVEIEMRGQLNRIGPFGYARVIVYYVVLDAYRNPIAEILAYQKILQLPWDPLELDISEMISHETHRDITYPIIEMPIKFEPGPYWIGVKCEIDLLRGGTIRGVDSESPFEIKIGKIVVAPS